jgi:hypothetical protein
MSIPVNRTWGKLSAISMTLGRCLNKATIARTDGRPLFDLPSSCASAKVKNMLLVVGFRGQYLGHRAIGTVIGANHILD